MVKLSLKPSACTPKAPHAGRPVLGVELTSALAAVFEGLASEARLRPLHAQVNAP